MESRITSGRVRIDIPGDEQVEDQALEIDLLEFRFLVKKLSRECQEQGLDDEALLGKVRDHLQEQGKVVLSLTQVDEIIDELEILYVQKKSKRNDRIEAVLSSPARLASPASPSNGTNS